MYASTVAWGIFKSGINGFNSWHDLSPLRQKELIGDVVFYGFVITILAFVDSFIATLKKRAHIDDDDDDGRGEKSVDRSATKVQVETVTQTRP